VKRKVRENVWEVFVDSFGWIALGNRDDAYHEQDAALYRDLKQQGARMVTTDDVLVEVCNGLSRLRLRHFARQLIAQIEIAKQQGALEVIHVTEDLFCRRFGSIFVPPR
jgi:predicted nucleic acid-binding protein